MTDNIKTLEERVRWLELYGTVNADSWLDIILKRLDTIERAIADTHQQKTDPVREIIAQTVYGDGWDKLDTNIDNWVRTLWLDRADAILSALAEQGYELKRRRAQMRKSSPIRRDE